MRPIIGRLCEAAHTTVKIWPALGNAPTRRRARPGSPPLRSRSFPIGQHSAKRLRNRSIAPGPAPCRCGCDFQSPAFFNMSGHCGFCSLKYGKYGGDIGQSNRCPAPPARRARVPSFIGSLSWQFPRKPSYFRLIGFSGRIVWVFRHSGVHVAPRAGHS